MRPTSNKRERLYFLEGSRHGLPVGDLKFVRGLRPVHPPTLMQSSYGAVNLMPDPEDEIIRRVPLFFAHGGRLYPSLALQTVMSALRVRPDQVSIVPGNEVRLVDTPTGTLRIPVDEHGQYRVNFAGDLGCSNRPLSTAISMQPCNRKRRATIWRQL